MKKQKNAQTEATAQNPANAPAAQSTPGVALWIFLGLNILMALVIVWKFLFSK